MTRMMRENDRVLAAMEEQRWNDADRIEILCDWVTNFKGAQNSHFYHEDYHFGAVCPYLAMAEVLRGRPDPRRAE